LWIEYFEHAREKIQESWERSKSPEYREDLWRYSQVLRSFEKHIQTALETGQMAEMVVAEMQEKESGRRTTEH
jgi:hypothetical protein